MLKFDVRLDKDKVYTIDLDNMNKSEREEMVDKINACKVFELDDSPEFDKDTRDSIVHEFKLAVPFVKEVDVACLLDEMFVQIEESLEDYNQVIYLLNGDNISHKAFIYSCIVDYLNQSF